MNNPNFICGTLEGFYGRPWRKDQRLQLFRWMEDWEGMNTYMYAPKDDLFHRSKWRELYPESLLKELKEMINSCQQKNLDFIYGIAPGLDMAYSDESDRQFLFDKINQIRECGCTQFAILFDDIPSTLSAEDQATFTTFARAQAHITNLLFEQFPQSSLIFCPTVYCDHMADYDVPGNPYLNELGKLLHEDIGFFWTGPGVVSTKISVETIKELRNVIKRKPIIWDNLHANDYDIRQIFFGPYSGRTLELKKEVAGILSNPNCQFWANYNPLRTLSMFSAETEDWNPRQAFLDSSKEWIQYFGNDELTNGEIQMLGDCFYVLGELGEKGKLLMSTIRHLKSNEPVDWGSHVTIFNKLNTTVNSLCMKLMAATNRDLLYDFYSVLWELREEMEYMCKWIEWRQLEIGEFKSTEIVPRRKGILAEMQKVLHKL